MKTEPCQWCGEPATLLCDTPLDGPGFLIGGYESDATEYVTCDARLCPACSLSTWTTLPGFETIDECPYCVGANSEGGRRQKGPHVHRGAMKAHASAALVILRRSRMRAAPIPAGGLQLDLVN